LKWLGVTLFGISQNKKFNIRPVVNIPATITEWANFTLLLKSTDALRVINVAFAFSLKAMASFSFKVSMVSNAIAIVLRFSQKLKYKYQISFIYLKTINIISQNLNG